MKELALNSERILGKDEESGLGLRDKARPKSVSWLKRLLQEVRASLDAPFKSDWEKKTGLHWREWGKL